jgi:peroxiredoxin (alkyl hydroperoxide reductase subunit C)
MLDVGSRAPDFTLTDQFGRKHTLSDLAGKAHVLLLFYPLDFTPT